MYYLDGPGLLLFVFFAVLSFGYEYVYCSSAPKLVARIKDSVADTKVKLVSSKIVKFLKTPVDFAVIVQVVSLRKKSSTKVFKSSFFCEALKVLQKQFCEKTIFLLSSSSCLDLEF